MARGGRELQQKMVEEENDTLKYLEFLHVAVLRLLIFIFNLYEHGKKKSGLFNPGVEFVEKIVKVIVRDDVIAVFMELLKFIDNKMDKVVVKLDRQVPPVVKKTITAAKKAVVYDIKRCGATYTASIFLKSIYTKYEPEVQRYVVWSWCTLNKLALFQQVTKMAVPAVGYCMEKYNDVVVYNKSGYVSTTNNYLPLLPTEKIVKVVMGDEAAESLRVWRRFCAPRTCFSFFA